MTDLREARAAAVRRRYRDLCDDLSRALPLLLDDLEAADREHVPDGLILPARELSGEEAAEFARRWLATKDGPLVVLPQEPREGAETAPGREKSAPAVNHPPGGARGAGGAAEAPARRRTARKGGTA